MPPPVKYELDKSNGILKVDRFMSVPMFYPENYGFIPGTLSGDGDPADVLVVTKTPLIPGCLIECRTIGGLHMQDESGEDIKLIGLPKHGLYGEFDDIENIQDLPSAHKNKIEHFFSHYKELESEKWVKIGKWFGLEDAEEEIMRSIERGHQGNS